MKLEVGMYVRFKPELKEQISKIIKFVNDGFLVLIDNTEYWFEESDVLKTSHNIFELIEPHDIIKTTKNEIYEVFAVGNDCVYINELKDFVTVDYIKEVLTKEQFENLSYKVGD